MPIKFNIDYANVQTSFTFIGEVTFKDIIDTLDPYLKIGLTKYRLFDVSKGTFKKLTLKQIDGIVKWTKNNSDKRPIGSKTAYVISADADHKTLKLFQSLTEIKGETWANKMFSTSYEAYEWLDLPMEGP
jgi:hypothetical protein